MRQINKREICDGNARVARRGFTLVELLVVMAVIATLAALLMPALAGARRKARAVTCLNNERQLGLLIFVGHLLSDDVEGT